MSKQFDNSQHDNIIHGLFRPTLISRGLAVLKKWQSRRSAVRVLSAMPDALLRDIGIERHQIKDAVHNFARRPEVVKMPDEKITLPQAVRKAA